MNNLNPTFTKPIDVDYHFEKVQKLQFSVFDIDNETSSLDDDDFLGQMDCNLGQVGKIVCWVEKLAPDVHLRPYNTPQRFSQFHLK